MQIHHTWMVWECSPRNSRSDSFSSHFSNHHKNVHAWIISWTNQSRMKEALQIRAILNFSIDFKPPTLESLGSTFSSDAPPLGWRWFFVFLGPTSQQLFVYYAMTCTPPSSSSKVRASEPVRGEIAGEWQTCWKWSSGQRLVTQEIMLSRV